MNTYEAMFLFDPTFATELSRVDQEVERLMQRAEAELVMSRKWDERKLAYEIKGRKRGCYVLSFFRAQPDRIAGIERDVQLSESILRVLITRVDYLTEQDMESAYPGRGEPAAPGRAEPEGRRREGGPPAPPERGERPQREEAGPAKAAPDGAGPAPAAPATAVADEAAGPAAPESQSPQPPDEPKPE